MAVLNKPALADFLRTVPGKSRDVLVRDHGSKPAGDAKLYIEVWSCATSGFFCGLQCSHSTLSILPYRDLPWQHHLSGRLNEGLLAQHACFLLNSIMGLTLGEALLNGAPSYITAWKSLSILKEGSKGSGRLLCRVLSGICACTQRAPAPTTAGRMMHAHRLPPSSSLSWTVLHDW